MCRTCSALGCRSSRTVPTRSSGWRGHWIPARSPRHGCEVQVAGDSYTISMPADHGRRTAEKRPSPLRDARRLTENSRCSARGGRSLCRPTRRISAWRCCRTRPGGGGWPRRSRRRFGRRSPWSGWARNCGNCTTGLFRSRLPMRGDPRSLARRGLHPPPNVCCTRDCPPAPGHAPARLTRREPRQREGTVVVGGVGGRRRFSQGRTSPRRLAFMGVHILIIFPGWSYGRTGIE
jgi:hypothetical protein